MTSIKKRVLDFLSKKEKTLLTRQKKYYTKCTFAFRAQNIPLGRDFRRKLETGNELQRLGKW